MAQPTDPPVSSESASEPVSAAEHVGVEPTVPEAVDPHPDAVATADPVVEEDAAEPVLVVDPDPEPEPVPAAVPVTVEPVVATPREVVYVQAPVPPAPHGNRGFGVLIALLGAAAFALLYMGAGALVIVYTPGANLELTFGQFVQSAALWVPVLVYAVFAVLFALIVNRAAWWAHVIGSLFVAVLSYAVSLGVLALMSNIVGMTPDAAVAQLAQLAVSPFLLIVLALAREVALWFGLAIASRGRKVKERNATERALFEQSAAERRAEYERAHPSA